jgi:D-aminoacyl-tRNA deacylase
MRHPGSILIVSSNRDPASSNIAQALITKNGFKQESGQEMETYWKDNVRLVRLEKLGIFVEPDDIPPNVSSAIFVSKHLSSSGRAALTVHATGNLTKEAKFGGYPEEVSHADPSMIRRALQALKAGTLRAGVQIDVTMEATHHGPTNLSMPVCFVEIGSGEKEWTDPVLGGHYCKRRYGCSGQGRRNPTEGCRLRRNTLLGEAYSHFHGRRLRNRPPCVEPLL